MFKRWLIAGIWLFLPWFGFSQGWRPGEMEVKIRIAHPDDHLRLRKITGNIEMAASDGSFARAYVTPDEYSLLLQTGLTAAIVIPDLNRHYFNFWDNPLVPPGYYSYEQIISIADSLATHFPSICKKEVWGNSVAGRQLAVLKISDNAGINEGEPEIMFDGGIHGDEVGGSQNLIMFARELCKSYGSDVTITELIDSREIYLFLMVNPDGRVSMSRYNQNGVDCNRDNGYMWDGEGFSPSAVSQPETRALRNGLLEHNFTSYTNFHSGIEIISCPWSYRPQAPRDYEHIQLLAASYSSTSGYAGGLVYGQGYNIMYPINGSTKDFQYGSLGNVGWSIEISTDKQPPSSQIQYFYNVNKPAMLEIIRQCGWGISGMVTDSLTGSPLQATIWINNFFPVYTDPVVGDYHKFLAPGTISVTVTANGYQQKTLPGVVVPSQGTATANFQMVPDTGWYATKVISCRIPNNNPGDEGNTPGCVGKPDGIPYAVGKNGWIILDMGDTLYNGTGEDFRVFQSGTTNKSFTVSGSLLMDGPFTTIGTGTGSTSFDLPVSLPKVKYLYLKDNGNGSSSGIGAGYNLDAISMLTGPLKASFSASNTSPCSGTEVNFTDVSGGNPVSWSWSFPGGTPSSSAMQHPTGIRYDQPGAYPVSLTISNGTSGVTTTKEDFIQVISAPEVFLGQDTVVCDYDQVTLDAGNSGASYLWSTGQTTPSITVDSTGTGYGTVAFWVLVTAANGCGGSDTIHITWDNCTGIERPVGQPMTMITPNPAGEQIKLSFREWRQGYWKITNIQGITVTQGIIPPDNHPVVLGCDTFPAGIYFLKAENPSFRMIRKIIISH